MADEVVGGGGSSVSADPVRDAVANSVADAGFIDEVASTPDPVEPTETVASDATPAAESVTPGPDPVATPSEPAATPETKPKTEDEEIAAIEAKLVAENPSMSRGQISRSRHQAMLTRRANEHTKALTEVQTKLSNYEKPEVQERLQGAVIFEQHPKVAWEQVITQDPRYKSLIDQHVEAEISRRGLAGAPPAAQPSATAAPTAPKTEDYPTPDALLPDGNLGYSAEALAKIRELDKKALQADFDKKLDERFKAIDGDLAPAREVRAAKEQLEKSYVNMGKLLTEARSTWPGFVENQKAIQAELGKPGNERMTLRQGYDKVVYGTLTEKVATATKTNEQIEKEVRARLIKEMNETAAAAGRNFKPGVPAVVTPTNEERPDPIRDAIAKAASTLR